MKKKKNRKENSEHDLLHYNDLTKFAARHEDHPQNDSPGDSAEDEFHEVDLGVSFQREPHRRKATDDDIPVMDRPHGDNDEELTNLDEEVGVVSSSRPDPVLDEEKSSSTH